MSNRTHYDYSTFVGESFGNWIIESYLYIKSRFHFYCICKCGESSVIQASSLINGRSKSCVVCAPKKHGYYGTATNRSWSGARNRCYNPKNKDYLHYGARGIKMCERWNKFENFLEDMGEKPEGLTLDRINNNGDYEPGNCRWATISQQNYNQRKRVVVKKITEGK